MRKQICNEYDPKKSLALFEFPNDKYQKADILLSLKPFGLQSW